MMAMVVKDQEALARIDTAKVRYVRMESAPASACARMRAGCGEHRLVKRRQPPLQLQQVS